MVDLKSLYKNLKMIDDATPIDDIDFSKALVPHPYHTGEDFPYDIIINKVKKDSTKTVFSYKHGYTPFKTRLEAEEMSLRRLIVYADNISDFETKKTLTKKLLTLEEDHPEWLI